MILINGMLSPKGLAGQVRKSLMRLYHLHTRFLIFVSLPDTWITAHGDMLNS